jgi:hypothetical protein
MKLFLLWNPENNISILIRVDSNFENKSCLVFILDLGELHITKLKQNLNSLHILLEDVRKHTCFRLTVVHACVKITLTKNNHALRVKKSGISLPSNPSTMGKTMWRWLLVPRLWKTRMFELSTVPRHRLGKRYLLKYL